MSAYLNGASSHSYLLPYAFGVFFVTLCRCSVGLIFDGEKRPPLFQICYSVSSPPPGVNLLPTYQCYIVPRFFSVGQARNLLLFFSQAQPEGVQQTSLSFQRTDYRHSNKFVTGLLKISKNVVTNYSVTNKVTNLVFQNRRTAGL